MDKYTLEELIEAFESHAILQEEKDKKWLEENPDDNGATFHFNLSNALHLICCEIDFLKIEIAILKYGQNAM